MPDADRPDALSPPRIDFLGVTFTRLSLTEAVDRILSRPPDAPFAAVVTPNADHLVRIDREKGAVLDAYRSAWLCVNDSRVVARLARWAGHSLPAVPGADLVAALMDRPDFPRDRPVVLIGGDPELASRLAGRFRLSDLRQHCPPMGLRSDPAARAEAVRFVLHAQAPIVFLAVGSPQQELLAAEIAATGAATGVGLCIGAGLEFLTGTRRRAPAWMRARGLEWLYRLLSEPGRLGRRYLIDSPKIFILFLKNRR